MPERVSAIYGQRELLDPAPRSLWNFAPGTFNMTGYTFAFNGPSCFLSHLYQNKKMLREEHSLTSPATNFLDEVSSRVIIADVVLSGNTTLPASGGNSFDNVSGSFYKPHLSASGLFLEDTTSRNFKTASQRFAVARRAFFAADRPRPGLLFFPVRWNTDRSSVFAFSRILFFEAGSFVPARLM